MVVDGAQVDGLLGEDGAAHGAARGTLFVDMLDDRAGGHARLGGAGGARLLFLDAPVTGSSPKAQTGTLTIMGGARGAFAVARPVFDAMGALILRGGERGQARW